MDTIQNLLQVSAKLFQLLETIPKGDKRDEYIEEVNQQLDERGKVIELLKDEAIQLNYQNKDHATLMELDKGIRERLEIIMQEVKTDMKHLQTAKKNEKQYSNPYSSVQVMDGMYYDKKK